jgi:putative phosphoesterase
VSDPAPPAAAIISDTHLPRGRRRLPDRCIQLLSLSRQIIHAGDLSTIEALEELRSLGPPVVAVHGNVDDSSLRMLLPEQAEIELGPVRVGIVHDAGPARGRLERLQARFPGCAAVIFGHSHIPLLERGDGFQIFNPGSPTDRRRQPVATMGLARLRRGALTFELVPLPPSG